MNEQRWPLAAWAAGGLLFVILATANGGGYRYGTSDQAFHIPAILRALNPATFPRDAGLIEAQGRFMVVHEIVAALVGMTGVSLPVVSLAGYLLSMTLIWVALILIGASVFHTPWATVALGAAFTLRHRIPRTSANSFEPYFNPRMLAFSLGLLAVAAILRRRAWMAVVLVAGAALVHVTTGLWFGVVVGVAIVAVHPRVRRVSVVLGGATGVVGVWALLAGPLRSSLRPIDPVWLAAVQSKDSLFPSQWPVWAWAANLGLPVVLWVVQRRRAARGNATGEDGALVLGGLALAALFLVALPAVTARLMLPTQLQISRVFWIVDFLVVLYVIALIAERGARAPASPTARVLAGVLLAVSVARGAYVMLVEFKDRELFRVHLSNTSWQDAMEWVKRQPLDVHVLADPGHAWKYGTSVRVAAERDVFLEETKDSALAIYSREVAVRVTERSNAIGDFGALSAAQGLELARRFDLDYLVTEARLPLPMVYSNAQFQIYALGTHVAASRLWWASPRTPAPPHLRTPAPPHPRTSAPPHPRTPAPPHPRTSAPPHLRTPAPPHPRTSAPPHLRTSAPPHPRTSAPPIP